MVVCVSQSTYVGLYYVVNNIFPTVAETDRSRVRNLRSYL